MLVHQAGLWGLTPIGLTELTDGAALQSRIDRKSVLPVADVEPLRAGSTRALRSPEIAGSRSFGCESVYFDGPEPMTYGLGVRERRRRLKIRVRTYMDSVDCWLAVKICGPRGKTVKHRLRYTHERSRVLDPGRTFVDAMVAGHSATDTRYLTSVPTRTIRCHRSTLFLPAAVSRVTIDTDVVRYGDKGHFHLPGLAVVETKTGPTASKVDRLLWVAASVQFGSRATGLALPRTIRHPVAAHPARVPRWSAAMFRQWSTEREKWEER